MSQSLFLLSPTRKRHRDALCSSESPLRYSRLYTRPAFRRNRVRMKLGIAVPLQSPTHLTPATPEKAGPQPSPNASLATDGAALITRVRHRVGFKPAAEYCPVTAMAKMSTVPLA